MLNLGICRKCPNCKSFNPAMIRDDGSEVRASFVDCTLVSMAVGWRSEIPEGCPYILEHKMTEDAVEDLGCEEEEGEENDAGV